MAAPGGVGWSAPATAEPAWQPAAPRPPRPPVPIATIIWLIVGLMAIGALALGTLIAWFIAGSRLELHLAAKSVIALTAATIALADSLRAALRWRVPRWIVPSLLFSLGLAAVVAYYQGFSFGYKPYYHRWEQFHSYVGARYFPELGYERLYPCALIAEDELGTVTGLDPKNEPVPLDLPAEIRAPSKTIRDVRTGTLRPVGNYLVDPDASCKGRFSPERWTAFKADVAFFRTQSDRGYWDDMQRDHGFHQTPVWLIAGRLFASLHPASVGYQQFLSILDPLFLIATFAALAWAFGLRVSGAAMVLWGCQATAPFWWKGGGFLAFDWLFYLVLAGCLAHKRRFMLAGAALVYATLISGFTIWILAGWGIVAVAAFLRRRRLLPSHRRAILGGAIAFGVLIAASSVAAGPTAYFDYLELDRVRAETPLTNDMGLRAVASHEFGGGEGSGRMEFAKEPRAVDPFARWKAMRNARFDRLFPIVALIGLAIFGFFIAAARRYRLLWIGHGLAPVLVVVGANIICPSYAFVVVWAVLTRVRRGLEVPLFGFAALTEILALTLSFNDDKYAWLSLATLALGVGLLGALLRPAAKRRTRRRKRRLDEHADVF